MFFTDLKTHSSIKLDSTQNELAKTFVTAFYKAQEPPSKSFDDPLDSLDDDVFAQFEELGAVDQNEYLETCFDDSNLFSGSAVTTPR